MIIDLDTEKAKKGKIVTPKMELERMQIKIAVNEVVKKLDFIKKELDLLYDQKLDDDDKYKLFEAVNSLPTC